MEGSTSVYQVYPVRITGEGRWGGRSFDGRRDLGLNKREQGGGAGEGDGIRKRGEGGGEGAYSFVAGLSHLTGDHASLSRRSTVPTRNGETSNVWALITFLPYITRNPFAYIIFLACLAVYGHQLSA